jgi:tetratricopeptide (TPR) repeat protein
MKIGWRQSSIFALVVALAWATAPPAWAQAAASARDHYRRGLSAYGLGDYETAASEYEAAFKAKPESALLFNAAQAHRIAGHRERALELYESYLRLFENQVPNRAEVERRILELRQQLHWGPPGNRLASAAPSVAEGASPRLSLSPAAPEASEPAASAPPVPSASPAESAPQPVPSAAPAESAPQPTLALALTTTAPPPEQRRPAWKKGWVWGTVGGVVAVAGLAVGLGLGLGAQSHNPTTSMGKVTF